MISIMGATGHTGREIARRLLEAGEQVRVLGRSAPRLAELERAGGVPFVGDAADPAFLTRAFSGADAVYALVPIDPRAEDQRAHADALGEAIVTAIRDARVPSAVCLSSVGADQPAGTGFIAALHAQELRLRTLVDMDVLILRPGSFFENFEASLELIERENLVADVVAPHVRLPMVATRDVATVAAEALATRSFRGVVVQELLGPRDLSHADATRILGEQMGRPELAYHQVPDEHMSAALMDAGFSPDAVRMHLEMSHAFNDGRVKAREPRLPRDSTPTRFEAYAEQLAQATRRLAMTGS